MGTGFATANLHGSMFANDDCQILSKSSIGAVCGDLPGSFLLERAANQGLACPTGGRDCNAAECGSSAGGMAANLGIG